MGGGETWEVKHTVNTLVNSDGVLRLRMDNFLFFSYKREGGREKRRESKKDRQRERERERERENKKLSAT
jgi:hypothetical protein